MRRRFEFRLARLLRIREVTERQARVEWAAYEARAHAAAARRAHRRDELAKARSSLADAMTDHPNPASQVLLDQRAVDSQLAALGRANEEAMVLEARADAAAARWRERDHERRTLEELRERARARHRRELALHDQAEADEVAIQRQTRRSDSDGAPARPVPEPDSSREA